MSLSKEEETVKMARDNFIIDPLEVILMGSVMEVLRYLPRELGSGELWERVRTSLPESTCS